MSRSSWFGRPPEARFSAAIPSSTAEKMIACMTSFAALAILPSQWTWTWLLPKCPPSMKRPFHKMHGLGNDFVIVDARDEPFEVTPSLAKAIANRRTGVGCDQLIVLEPSTSADLRMRIWNQDGGEVQACGNATRCVVQLTGAKTIDSDGGVLTGEDLGAEVEVVLEEPSFEWDQIPLAYPVDTAALPMAWDGLERPMAVNVGNPHVVFFVDKLDSVPIEELGPRIENDAAFPERINVNVAEMIGDGILLKTWERG